MFDSCQRVCVTRHASRPREDDEEEGQAMIVFWQHFSNRACEACAGMPEDTVCDDLSTSSCFTLDICIQIKFLESSPPDCPLPYVTGPTAVPVQHKTIAKVSAWSDCMMDLSFNMFTVMVCVRCTECRMIPVRISQKQSAAITSP